jgi:hypothetical protein
MVHGDNGGALNWRLWSQHYGGGGANSGYGGMCYYGGLNSGYGGLNSGYGGLPYDGLSTGCGSNGGAYGVWIPGHDQGSSGKIQVEVESEVKNEGYDDVENEGYDDVENGREVIGEENSVLYELGWEGRVKAKLMFVGRLVNIMFCGLGAGEWVLCGGLGAVLVVVAVVVVGGRVVVVFRGCVVG